MLHLHLVLGKQDRLLGNLSMPSHPSKVSTQNAPRENPAVYVERREWILECFGDYSLGMTRGLQVSLAFLRKQSSEAGAEAIHVARQIWQGSMACNEGSSRVRV